MAFENVLNYTEQGGAKTVIGGTLEVKEGATVTGLADVTQLVAATENTLGCVKAAAKGAGDTVAAKIGTDGKLYVPTYPAELTPAANQADSTAEELAELVTDFNALLAKLQAAGLMDTE